MKTCSKCEVEQGLENFYKDKGSKDGLRTDCKSCCLNRQIKYYQSNRERLLAKQALYYKAHHETAIEYAREWRKDNPDKTREYHRKYAENNKESERIRHREKSKRERLNHPERIKERGLRWRLNNPDKVTIKNQRRRVLTTGSSACLILDRELDDLLSRPCANCGRLSGQTLDHVVPLSRGGRHSIGNLQTLCKPCNSSKGRKTLTEWRHSKRLLGVG